jgi:predicted GNAT superfamily acetyltransferase
MKVAQRIFALELGYHRIKWTFSALRSVNAHLYITRLGGIGSQYVFDTRGSFDSDWVTEGGVPLDEFVVEWELDSERVRSRVGGARPEPAAAAHCISRCSGSGPDRVLDEIDTEPAADQVVCEVPADFQYLVDNALDLALDWRNKTRPAFARLMEQGFALTECFYAREHGPRYLFERSTKGTAS